MQGFSEPASGVLFHKQLVKPRAVAIAVSVVRMMFTITLHLVFFSFVIGMNYEL